MPNLIEKIKPVGLVKKKFEHRENLKLKNLLCKSRTTKMLKKERITRIFGQKTRLQVLCFRLRVCKEIILVVVHIYEFKYLAKCKEIALFWLFGLSRIRWMDQNKTLTNWILFDKQEVLDGDFGWRNHTCNYWKNSVWIWKQNKNFI